MKKRILPVFVLLFSMLFINISCEKKTKCSVDILAVYRINSSNPYTAVDRADVYIGHIINDETGEMGNSDEYYLYTGRTTEKGDYRKDIDLPATFDVVIIKDGLPTNGKKDTTLIGRGVIRLVPGEISTKTIELSEPYDSSK